MSQRDIDKRRDRQRKDVSNIRMQQILYSKKPVTVGYNPNFNYKAHADGRKWYEDGLTMEQLYGYIEYIDNNGQKTDEILNEVKNLSQKLQVLSHDIDVLNNDDNKFLNLTIERLTLLNSLRDLSYRKAFVIGWNNAKEAYMRSNYKEKPEQKNNGMSR